MIIVYFLLVYSAVWGSAFTEEPGNTSFNRTLEMPRGPNTGDWASARLPFSPRGRVSVQNPLAAMTSPVPLVILFSGLLSIGNGLALRSLVQKKEVERVKVDLRSKYLTPDEKHAIGELEKNGGELLQKELGYRLDLSRVKVHRIIQKLEDKGVVKKIPYGRTNKIILDAD